MVTVDKAVIARLEKDGKVFEILVDPEMAYAFREGKSVSIANMLAVDDVYKDSKKGLPASKQDIEKVFGTDEIVEIATKILKNGEIQLTTELRRKKLAEKERQIAEFISKNTLDPQTKKPHPQQRILNAMEQAKVHVDAFKSVDEQIEGIIESLRRVLPISFEKIKMEIKIPAQFAGRCFGILKGFGAEPQWMKDGSLYAIISIPAGLRDEVFAKLNNVAHGEAEINEK